MRKARFITVIILGIFSLLVVACGSKEEIPTPIPTAVPPVIPTTAPTVEYEPPPTFTPSPVEVKTLEDEVEETPPAEPTPEILEIEAVEDEAVQKSIAISGATVSDQICAASWVKLSEINTLVYDGQSLEPFLASITEIIVDTPGCETSLSDASSESDEESEEEKPTAADLYPQGESITCFQPTVFYLMQELDTDCAEIRMVVDTGVNLDAIAKAVFISQTMPELAGQWRSLVEISQDNADWSFIAKAHLFGEEFTDMNLSKETLVKLNVDGLTWDGLYQARSLAESKYDISFEDSTDMLISGLKWADIRTELGEEDEDAPPPWADIEVSQAKLED